MKTNYFHFHSSLKADTILRSFFILYPIPRFAILNYKTKNMLKKGESEEK